MIHAFGMDAPDAVFAFLEQDVSARGREHWCWKYRIGEGGAAAAFYWQEADGSVLGFIGLLRTMLHTRTGQHPSAWFVDWHVRPGAKGVGVGIGLLRKAEAAAGMLLTLQGSADTQKILPRMGWKQSLAPVTWLRPLSRRFLSAWLERRGGAGCGRAARALSVLASPYLRCRPPATPVDVELVDVDRFTRDYDETWNARALEFAPTMSRDSDYLNYLCGDYPEKGYRIQLAKLRGKTVGHLISRVDADKSGLRRGRIVDLLWPQARPELAAWLLRSSCAALQRGGADYVECLASIPALRSALQTSRFRARRPVPIWYHHLAAGAPDPATWHITLLDCDRAYR